MPRIVCCVLPLVLLSFTLSACSMATETEGPTPSAKPVMLILPTSTASATLTHIPPTPTARATSRPSPTVQPTETPVPVLPVAEAEQLAERLIESNAGCNLPCWWGITPGQTSWSAAKSFLHQFDPQIYARYAERQEPFVAEALIPVRQEIFSIGRLTHSYAIDAGTVQLIEAFPGQVPAYLISRFFSDYGQPQEIWVFTDLGMIHPENWLLIVVYYPEHGVIGVYYIKGPVIGDHLRACFPASVANALILWAPSPMDDFKSIINRTGFTEHGVGYEAPYRTLQDATGVTVDQLFTEVSKPNTHLCLETPITLWGG